MQTTHSNNYNNKRQQCNAPTFAQRRFSAVLYVVKTKDLSDERAESVRHITMPPQSGPMRAANINNNNKQIVDG